MATSRGGRESTKHEINASRKFCLLFVVMCLNRVRLSERSPHLAQEVYAVAVSALRRGGAVLESSFAALL